MIISLLPVMLNVYGNGVMSPPNSLEDPSLNGGLKNLVSNKIIEAIWFISTSEYILTFNCDIFPNLDLITLYDEI